MSAAVSSTPDWLFRSYDADQDESAIFYLLGVGYARSRAGYRAGAEQLGSREGVEGLDDRATRAPERRVKEQAFLAAHGPVWRWLIKHAEVTLAVDPERPSDIWAWMVTSEPNIVHAIGCKRSVIKAGLAKELVMDLAGDRWRTHQVVTLELPQLRTQRGKWTSSHLIDLDRPYEWSLDPTWLLTRMVSR